MRISRKYDHLYFSSSNFHFIHFHAMSEEKGGGGGGHVNDIDKANLDPEYLTQLDLVGQ